MAGTYTSATLTVEVTGEKEELLTLLTDQRELFRVTVRGLDDDQARQRSTVSELTLGGLLKHLAVGERGTAALIVENDQNSEIDVSELGEAYVMLPGETLAGWTAGYDAAAAELDAVIAEADLDELIAQPTAPWQPERQWWSVRKMMLHMLRETAHHCGHADIIREAIDGQSTMAAISEGSDWADQDWTG